MRSILSIVVVLGVAAALGLAACNSEQPASPYPQGLPQGYPQAYPQMPPAQQPQAAVPVQPAAQAPANPLAGLAALGQAMGQMAPPQQAGQPVQAAAPAALVPWQSLSQALPTAAPGWAMQGQIEGSTANAMGIAVSTAKCDLTQGAMTADVEIVDNAMTAGLAAMTFTMVPTIDSSEERSSRVNFGTYPGMQSFKKQSNRAEVTVIVSNRILITVKVNNAGSEAPALQLAQMVNYALLTSLIGG
jgi:hypothetical protein